MTGSPKRLHTVAITGHGTADIDGYLAQSNNGDVFITDRRSNALYVESMTDALLAKMKPILHDRGWRLVVD